MDFKFTPYKDFTEVIRKYGTRDYPLWQLLVANPVSSQYLQSAYKGMTEMLGTARTVGYGEDVIKQLEGYASRLSPNYVPKEMTTAQRAFQRRGNDTITSQANFQKLYTEYGNYLQAQSRKKAEEQEVQRERELEAQRVEVRRAENYNKATGSGDLAGHQDSPTVISGGSQNVDTSRLNVGSDSRRRRGRGIQSQLGL